MIRARTVNLSLENKRILRDVSVDVFEREIVALCGPNGAGKSSLLSCLAVEHRACADNIYYDDRIASSMSSVDLSYQRVVLEQTPSISAEFTLRELIGLSAPIAISVKQLDDLVDKVIADFEFTEIQDTIVSKLSGGQRHRAHLARILVQYHANKALGYSPTIFLDEPTASLDIGYQIKILKLMRRLANQGAGILVVLHDLNIAAAFANRVILMSKGRVLHEGAPDTTLTANILSDVYNTPIFVERAVTGQIIIQPSLEFFDSGHGASQSIVS